MQTWIKIKEYFKRGFYLLNIIIAKFISLFVRGNMRKRNIWLIGVQCDRYENNVKTLYEYIEGKDIQIFWVLEKKNIHRFYNKIPHERMLIRGSVHNYVYAINSVVGIYAESDYDIAPGLYKLFKEKTFLVNINHGYDAIKMLSTSYYSKLPCDLICCASDNERTVKENVFGADSSISVVTGYARCDDYVCKDNLTEDIHRIMIMQTWRPWYISERISMNNSQLFCKYFELLDVMCKKNILNEECKVFFIMHPIMADYFKDKEIYSSPYINYIYEPNEIGKYLLSTDLLITDYSSVAFDYIYMKKPVIYFWFDYEEYKARQGLYKEKLDFDNVCFTYKEVLDCIYKVFNSKVKYSVRDREKYWKFSDKKNSERIYNEIINRLNIKSKDK